MSSTIDNKKKAVLGVIALLAVVGAGILWQLNRWRTGFKLLKLPNIEAKINTIFDLLSSINASTPKRIRAILWCGWNRFIDYFSPLYFYRHFWCLH